MVAALRLVATQTVCNNVKVGSNALTVGSNVKVGSNTLTVGSNVKVGSNTLKVGSNTLTVGGSNVKLVATQTVGITLRLVATH